MERTMATKQIYTAHELEAMSDSQLANLVHAMIKPEAAYMILQQTRETIIAAVRGAMLAMLDLNESKKG
jgi:hypothetical protein